MSVITEVSFQTDSDQESQTNSGKSVTLLSDYQSPKFAEKVTENRKTQPKPYEGQHKAEEKPNDDLRNFCARKLKRDAQIINVITKPKHRLERLTVQEKEVRMRNFCDSNEPWSKYAEGIEC
jgi:hypothetical protein